MNSFDAIVNAVSVGEHALEEEKSANELNNLWNGALIIKDANPKINSFWWREESASDEPKLCKDCSLQVVVEWGRVYDNIILLLVFVDEGLREIAFS